MYKSATNPLEAQRVMVSAKAPDPEDLGRQAWECGGNRRLPVRVAIWQGDGDNVVNRDNAKLLVRQFVALNDLADDGRDNDSVGHEPRTESGRQQGGHAYRVTRYDVRGRPLIELYEVDEMGHAWSGGKHDLLFSDGKGPDASMLIWSFFEKLSR